MGVIRLNFPSHRYVSLQIFHHHTDELLLQSITLPSEMGPPQSFQDVSSTDQAHVMIKAEPYDRHTFTFKCSTSEEGCKVLLDEDITKRIQIGNVNFTTPGYLMKFPEGPQMIFRAKVDEMHTMSVIAAVESSFVALSISNKK